MINLSFAALFAAIALLLAASPVAAQKQKYKTAWTIKTYNSPVGPIGPQIYEAYDSAILVTDGYIALKNPVLEQFLPSTFPVDSATIVWVVQKYSFSGRLLWEKFYLDFYTEQLALLKQSEEGKGRLKSTPIFKVQPAPNGKYIFSETNYLDRENLPENSIADTLILPSAAGGNLVYTFTHGVNGQHNGGRVSLTKLIKGKTTFHYEYDDYSPELYHPDNYKILPTPDGGYLAAFGQGVDCGTGPDCDRVYEKVPLPYVIKLNSEGKKIWDRQLGGRTNNFVDVLKCFSDNSSVVEGSYFFNNFEDHCRWIHKLTPEGTTAWVLENESVSLLGSSPNGNILVKNGSWGSTSAQYQMYLPKGELLWALPHALYPDFYFLRVFNDGSAEVLVKKAEPDLQTLAIPFLIKEAALVRINKKGKAEEVYRFSEADKNIYRELALSDGSYLVTILPFTKTPDGTITTGCNFLLQRIVPVKE